MSPLLPEPVRICDAGDDEIVVDPIGHWLGERPLLVGSDGPEESGVDREADSEHEHRHECGDRLDLRSIRRA